MRRTPILITMLAFMMSRPAFSQGRNRNDNAPLQGGQPSLPSIPDPRTDGPDTLPRVLYVSGRVVTEDGTPPPERVLMQSNCEGNVRTEGYTDQKGLFSFEFADTRNRALSGTVLAPDSTSHDMPPGGLRQNTPSDWRKCELKAVLAGFSAPVVDLSTQPRAFGHVDIGRMVLRHTGSSNSATISANSAQAPPEAVKKYEKGLEEKKKANLEAAQQQFRKALDAYPQFAVAWLELGRVQIQQKDVAAGRASLRQAVAADPKLLGAYQELAQLAAREKQWQEVADLTDKLLELDSTGYPEFWFYNCVSKYQLGNLEVAEKSAVQGIRIDTEHRVPKMEFVLGTILFQKRDYPGAAQHLREYVRLLPNGPDAAEAHKKLAEIAKAP